MDVAVIHLGIGLGLQNVVGWFLPIFIGVANVLPMLLTVFFYADKSREYNHYLKSRNSSDENSEYDFIIVGGGTSGSVLASRLSQHFKVLLLELGGEPNPLTSVPGMQSQMIGHPQVDHMYLTVPQNSSCLSLVNRQSQWSSGLGLGGTSMINDMVYMRGHPYDYDRWATYVQDARWSYKNLIPHFLRSEGYCDSCDSSYGIKPSVVQSFHNTNGELPVRPLPITPIVPEFLEALEWGSVSKGDMNAPFNKPIADANAYTIKKGRRVSTYNAFVEGVADKRETLKIIKYARVIQVIFEPGTNRVVGVKYERFGKLEVSKARKEVILSAGAVATPKILLLSGIGPVEDLMQLKIPLVVNLPVGRNLQDHVGTLLGPFIIHQPLSIIKERDMDEDEAEVYLHNGVGPFAISNLRASTLWTSTKALNAGQKEWPDIHVHMMSNGISETIEKDFSRQYNLREDVMKDFFDPVKGRDAFFLMVNNGRPKARGLLRLKSNNFLDPALIDPRYYQDPQLDDVHVTMEGLMRAVYLVENAPAFKKIGAKLSPIPFPTCKHTVFRSADYWECVVRQYTLSAGHFSGTCSMGPITSPYSVVDPELRVIGVRGLRVIDSSIMPFIVSTNPYAATIMIAEKGANLIISGYK